MAQLAPSGYVTQVDADFCAACGLCVAQCPQEAFSLVRDPAKGEPLEIQTLIARAAESAFDN